MIERNIMKERGKNSRPVSGGVGEGDSEAVEGRDRCVGDGGDEDGGAEALPRAAGVRLRATRRRNER